MFYQNESWDDIEPRYYLPGEDGRSKIPDRLEHEPGRVLSVYDDPGYGTLVSQQQAQGDTYSQKLVDAAVRRREPV